MVEKFCEYLTLKIRKKMPEVDDERAEVIKYGLELLIGEVPKTFIILGVAALLGVFVESFITCLLILPYKATSGGFHLKTHVGCVLMTILFYCGIAATSKYVLISSGIRYMLTGIVWIFGMVMIKLYAPADTENVPILAKKDRMIRRNLSYVIFSMSLIISILITNEFIANVLLIGYFMQTLTITKLAYKVTKTKCGYEVYQANVV